MNQELLDTMHTTKLDDWGRFVQIRVQAFDIGIGFFAEDTKAGRVQNRKGFAELMDLATFSASQPLDTLQPKIQALPDGWLKAYLWLYEVEGHGKQKAQTTVPTTCAK